MRKILFSLVCLISFLMNGQKQTQSIGFIENKGQIIDQKGRKNSKVKYLLNSNGLNVQLRQNGFSYDVYEIKKHQLTKRQKERFYPSNFIKEDTLKNPNYSLEYIYHRIDIDFKNSNTSVQLIAEEKSSDYDNYYNVPNEPNGILDVHKFQKVTYKNIYNNIDVVFFIPEDKTKPVEYNFIVKPNGNIDDIKLEFKGTKTELVDNKIKMNIRFGQMEETLPLSWTENGLNKNNITVGYKKVKNNVYGFESNNDITGKKVIIDPTPVRLWGTYCGGDGSDYINVVISDLNGNIYSGGTTTSFNNISTIGAHQSTHWPLYSPNFFDHDCFIVKMNSSGIRLWGTYLGGNEEENLKGIAIDKLNNLIATGFSNSKLNSITSVGSFQQNLNYNFLGSSNNIDAFLVKFDANGTRIWGTFFGGNLNDSSNCISVNELNEIIIGGITFSETNIATPGCHKSIFSNSFNTQYDGFIAKFDSLGNRIWGTYYGGDIQENVKDIKTDNLNNIYLTGNAYSTNGISTLGSYQYNKSVGGDGFISKFSSSGNQIWGTYFGGESDDYLNKLVIGNNAIYLAGKTASNSNISSANAFLPIGPHSSNNGFDGILLKFDFDGNRIWSTYFYEELFDLDIDINENIFFVGYTQSNSNISTTNSYQSILSFADSYIQKFNTNGQRIWGTYYGGESFDNLYSIEYDNINNYFYVGGFTSSSNDIGTSNVMQPNYSGYYEDGLIAKFQDCLTYPLASSNTPTCIGTILNLTASGGTNYSWTGPNGFTSNLQNPTIPNANASHSGQYSCLITGTGGCDGTNTINVVVGDSTKPTPNINPLPTISGDCNTTISIPKATDNCAGSITATTTDPIAYNLPGNYTINWKYDDGNGNIETQTQTVTITAVALPTVASTQNFCIQQNATINSITITGQNIKWYDATTNGNLLPSTTTLINGTTYYASQTINGCESLRSPVTINIQNTIAPTGNATQSFCSTQNATLSDIVISGININWYNSTTSTALLPSTTLLVNGSTYYATQTVNGCESIGRLSVIISLINTLNATDYSETLCDNLDDGFETINLINYQPNLITNTSGCTFEYYYSQNGATNQVLTDKITNTSNYNLTVGSHTLFVRITSTNTCHQIVKLILELFSNPLITIPNIVPLCDKSNVSVDAGSGFTSYQWSTGATSQSVSITQPGNYNVTVNQNHGGIVCSSTKTFQVVLSNVATILNIETIDMSSNDENIIMVNLSTNSLGDYEYSIDGIHYQNSNIFSNLSGGDYTIYVKDKNGCGITKDEVFLLTYPKFFTPNGDGYNDTWKIKFSEIENGLTVKIFDRYGKLLKTLDNKSAWDGTYNNNIIISDDYWFVIYRANGKEHRGNFTLKR